MVTIWCAAVIQESGSVLVSFLKNFLAANLTLKEAFPPAFFKAQKPVVFAQEMAFIWWNLYRKQPCLKKPRILVSTDLFKTVSFSVRLHDGTVNYFGGKRLIHQTFNLKYTTENEEHNWKSVFHIKRSNPLVYKYCPNRLFHFILIRVTPSKVSVLKVWTRGSVKENLFRHLDTSYLNF